MSSFIDKMLGGWGGDNDNERSNPEIEKNQQDMRKKASYVSGVAVLIAWGIFLSSENHQEKTEKEVVIPTKDTIHKVLSDSIMNQEDIDKEEWQQEGEQQGLSPQEIEE